ncbi:MAG: hypothetical protein CVU44_14085 [Chloroflexi bacterium HGW-Chloroflexi-6]|nr:MAG: hypothetical protein CVU44_14085 [Chloroflexi bacterium HGW-Chloroflexi-6]
MQFVSSSKKMKITFTRHGQSLANTLHIISNHNLPHPLTNVGRQQADDLSLKLAPTRFERIYTSPVPRAVETAQILSGALKLPVTIEPALREYDCGELEGRGDPEAWKIHRQFVLDWFDGLQRDECPPGGETFHDIQKRMRTFLNTLSEEFGETNAHILCVSHGGTLVFGLPELLTNIDFAFARQNIPDHTDLIVAQHGSDGWHCLAWGSRHP